MGLDMYLSARQYLWKHDDEISTQRKKISELLGVDGVEAKSVIFEAMYWRKANAIHNWFVDNVQDGDDDCKENYVETEQLEQLLADCIQALETKDSDVLPPTEGFFFGSTEVDEYYWADIAETKEKLSSLLNNEASKKWDFYYQSSW